MTRALRTGTRSLPGALAAAALVLVIAAGCGGGSDRDGPSPQPNATAAAGTTSEAPRSEAARLEADPAPELPGELVDLQSIYGGFYGNDDGPTTAPHVTEDVDYSDQGLPPAGGPHWGQTSCRVDDEGNPEPTPFCGPVPWGVYREPWPAESLMHNIEHGGVVIWYHTSDQAVIDELEQIAVDRLNQRMLVVLTPYPEMAEEHVAITSWARRDLFPVQDYERSRVEDFVDVHERRFNPEDF